MTKKISYEILLLRCVGCLFVVMVHSLIFTGRLYEQSAVLNAARLIFNVGTPIFIFITEFLIAKNYKENLPKHFISKRMKVLIPPFIAMGIIGSIYKVYENQEPYTVQTILTAIFRNIFMADYNGYFILIIIQFILIHYLLHNKLKHWSAKTVLPISFIINFLYLSFFNFVPPFGFSNPSTAEYIWYYTSWLPFIGWSFYFALGYYCGKHYDSFLHLLNRKKRWVWSLPIITAIPVLAFKYLDLSPVISSKGVSYLLFAPSIIFLIFYISNHMKSVPNFMVSISDHSFGIYLTHSVFMRVFVIFYMPLTKHIHPFITIPIIYITCFCAAWLTTKYLNKLSFGKYIVGPVRNNLNAVQREKQAAPILASESSLHVLPTRID
ncbi:membrane-bound acyltransferase YfiQ involved in biofilm formation [Paenibacillus castaneae]|uniref:acyltransferase family protein n=1 Tax=Paenibacillus castaneae TaxID=474957 RepID=UPI000C9A2670|nr:acyltransferase family protein [Paenibacillus castaneae]NIK75432.1 membrane-bound acyltransferase YfiQ involved in biofilm formation [Paenibacillus castaneae]